ncbi:MAG: hypothetical protein HC879_21130 [Leptolyngbyaceae cyanobacterium SL_5_9]|nr:hypothetical protein [Leptolyngbyaceae cyanobacterium SL_5_9]NJO75953.1 hypothetical protein [Leptolyngbyaceae cyanobacterium RM1_406_9]
MISRSEPELKSAGRRLAIDPWCVVRFLPNSQRFVAARFHRRSDADGYLQVLRRLLPTAQYEIVFEAIAPEEMEDMSRLEQRV